MPTCIARLSVLVALGLMAGVPASAQQPQAQPRAQAAQPHSPQQPPSQQSPSPQQPSTSQQPAAQQKADPAAPAPGATDLPSPRPVRRILPDGTIETQLPDGTVKTQPPGESALELMPELTREAALDPTTLAKYREALRGYYDYRLHGYDQRRRTFAWQLFSSKVIFWAVLALVFAGIYFAAVQFHVGLRRGPRDGQATVMTTEFAASVEGVKVSSPVLGVIILVISLAFFYLYLIIVYPIREIL